MNGKSAETDKKSQLNNLKKDSSPHIVTHSLNQISLDILQILRTVLLHIRKQNTLRRRGC